MSNKIMLCLLAVFVLELVAVNSQIVFTLHEKNSLFQHELMTFIHVYNATLDAPKKLKTLSNVQVKECARVCALDHECKSFVYKKSLKTCYLSRNNAALDKVVLRNYHFDYYQVIPDNGNLITVRGASIDRYDHLEKLDDISLTSCIAQCNIIKHCIMFEYKQEQRRCHLTNLNHVDKNLTASIHGWDYHDMNGVLGENLFLKVIKAYLRRGSVYKRTEGTTAERCAQSCLLDLECRSFEFLIYAKSCVFSKEDASTDKLVKSDRGRDYYQLERERGHMNIVHGASIPGHDPIPTKWVSLENCEALCAERNDCAAFEYKASNRKCDMTDVTHHDYVLEVSIHGWSFFEFNA